MFRFSCIVLLLAGLSACDEAGGDVEPLTPTAAASDAPAVEKLDAAAANPDASAIPPLIKRPPLTVEQVHDRIREKNPAYAGTGQIVIEEGKVVAVDLRDAPVIDLSPLADFPLRELYLENTPVANISALDGMPLEKLYLSNTQVKDLSPLRGLPITELNLVGLKATDITPLKGMPLKMLWLNDVPVSDIRPLTESPLVSVTLKGTKVADISPVAEIESLERLHIADTPVADLTPIRQLSLTRLVFDPARITKGIMDARKIATMKEIGTTLQTMQPPIPFWKAYDAGSFR